MPENFYKNGLRFKCTQCHACCRHDPGYVFLSRSDLTRLAAGLNISEDDVVSRYCRKVDIGGFTRISLTEKSNFDCVFWDQGCTVYQHRPLQCRGYPFWASSLSDKAAWEAEATHCPGIGQGPLHSEKKIDAWVRLRANERLMTEWPEQK